MPYFCALIIFAIAFFFSTLLVPHWSNNVMMILRCIEWAQTVWNRSRLPHSSRSFCSTTKKKIARFFYSLQPSSVVLLLLAIFPHRDTILHCMIVWLRDTKSLHVLIVTGNINVCDIFVFEEMEGEEAKSKNWIYPVLIYYSVVAWRII